MLNAGGVKNIALVSVNLIVRWNPLIFGRRWPQMTTGHETAFPVSILAENKIVTSQGANKTSCPALKPYN